MSKKQIGFGVGIAALMVAVAIGVAWNSKSGKISATADAASLQVLADQAAEPLKESRWLDSHIALGPAMSRRREAFSRIERYGPKSIPVLLTLSEHPDRDVSGQARSSLRNVSKQLDPADQSAMLLLLAVLEMSGRPTVAAWSRQAIYDIGNSQSGVDAVMAPLADASLRADVVLELAEDWLPVARSGATAETRRLLTNFANRTQVSNGSAAERTLDVWLLQGQIDGAMSLLSDSYHTRGLPKVSELVEQMGEPGPGRGMALQGLSRIAEGNAAVAGLDLGALTPDLSAAVPALIQMAERNSTIAIKTLGLIGPDARDAVPTLLVKLEPSRMGVGSVESTTALGMIGVKDRSVISALVESLAAEPTDVSQSNFDRKRRPWTMLDQQALRKSVAKSLGQLAAHADLSVPALIALLDFGYVGGSEGQNIAAEAVMAFGSDGHEAIPKLTELLASDYTVQMARTSLRLIDPDSNGATTYLASQLESQESLLQIQAARALAVLGRDARSAISALQAAADNSEDELVASWLAYTLWKIDPASHDPDKAVPALISVLESRAYPFASKQSALADLGAMGPTAKSAMPAIFRLRTDQDNYTLLPAITEAELKIGPIRSSDSITSSSESESFNAEPKQDLEVLKMIVKSMPDHRPSALEAEYDAARNLVRLSLIGVALEHSRVDQLRLFDHLRELDLRSCRLPDGISEFTISKIMSLENLSLDGCRSISDIDLTYLARMPNLQRVQLGGTKVTFNGVEAFESERPGVIDPSSLDAIRFGPLRQSRYHGLKGELGPGLKLKSLQLNALSTPPEVLGGILSKCGSLQSLTLRSAPITDEALKQLRHCPRLEVLDLMRVQGITPAGAKSIAELSGLRKLVLESTDVDDDGVIQFANLHHLESLNLNSCTRVSDTGILALANLRELRELRLLQCRRLTSAVIPVFEGLPNLEFLNIGASSFSRQERDQIRQKLPDCKIQF